MITRLQTFAVRHTPRDWARVSRCGPRRAPTAKTMLRFMVWLDSGDAVEARLVA
jgi:hypothetical protein